MIVSLYRPIHLNTRLWMVDGIKLLISHSYLPSHCSYSNRTPKSRPLGIKISRDAEQFFHFTSIRDTIHVPRIVGDYVYCFSTIGKSFGMAR